MKLRLRENSVRLRLSRTEVASFIKNGLVEEALEFTPQPLVYILHSSNELKEMHVSFTNGWLTVTVPEALGKTWFETDQVGMESVFHGVAILVEKDWSCAHGSAEENEDTFSAPHR